MSTYNFDEKLAKVLSDSRLTDEQKTEIIHRIFTGNGGLTGNGQDSNGQGSDGQGSDGNGQGSDGQGSNSQGSNGQDSNGQGSNSQGSNSQGSNSQGSNSQGSNGQGSNSQGSNSQGSNGQDSNGQGSNSQGSNGQGSNGQDSNGQGSNSQGSNGQGSNGKDSGDFDLDDFVKKLMDDSDDGGSGTPSGGGSSPFDTNLEGEDDEDDEFETGDLDDEIFGMRMGALYAKQMFESGGVDSEVADTFVIPDVKRMKILKNVNESVKDDVKNIISGSGSVYDKITALKKLYQPEHVFDCGEHTMLVNDAGIEDWRAGKDMLTTEEGEQIRKRASVNKQVDQNVAPINASWGSYNANDGVIKDRITLIDRMFDLPHQSAKDRGILDPIAQAMHTRIRQANSKIVDWRSELEDFVSSVSEKLVNGPIRQGVYSFSDVVARHRVHVPDTIPGVILYVDMTGSCEDFASLLVGEMVNMATECQIETIHLNVFTTFIEHREDIDPLDISDDNYTFKKKVRSQATDLGCVYRDIDATYLKGEEYLDDDYACIVVMTDTDGLDTSSAEDVAKVTCIAEDMLYLIFDNRGWSDEKVASYLPKGCRYQVVRGSIHESEKVRRIKELNEALGSVKKRLKPVDRTVTDTDRRATAIQVARSCGKLHLMFPDIYEAVESAYGKDIKSVNTWERVENVPNTMYIDDNGQLIIHVDVRAGDSKLIKMCKSPNVNIFKIIGDVDISQLWEMESLPKGFPANVIGNFSMSSLPSLSSLDNLPKHVTGNANINIHDSLNFADSAGIENAKGLGYDVVETIPPNSIMKFKSVFESNTNESVVGRFVSQRAANGSKKIQRIMKINEALGSVKKRLKPVDRTVTDADRRATAIQVARTCGKLDTSNMFGDLFEMLRGFGWDLQSVKSVDLLENGKNKLYITDTGTLLINRDILNKSDYLNLAEICKKYTVTVLYGNVKIERDWSLTQLFPGFPKKIVGDFVIKNCINLESYANFPTKVSGDNFVISTNSKKVTLQTKNIEDYLYKVYSEDASSTVHGNDVNKISDKIAEIKNVAGDDVAFNALKDKWHSHSSSMSGYETGSKEDKEFWSNRMLTTDPSERNARLTKYRKKDGSNTDAEVLHRRAVGQKYLGEALSDKLDLLKKPRGKYAFDGPELTQTGYTPEYMDKRIKNAHPDVVLYHKNADVFKKEIFPIMQMNWADIPDSKIKVARTYSERNQMMKALTSGNRFGGIMIGTNSKGEIDIVAGKEYKKDPQILYYVADDGMKYSFADANDNQERKIMISEIRSDIAKRDEIYRNVYFFLGKNIFDISGIPGSGKYYPLKKMLWSYLWWCLVKINETDSTRTTEKIPFNLLRLKRGHDDGGYGLYDVKPILDDLFGEREYKVNKSDKDGRPVEIMVTSMNNAIFMLNPSGSNASGKRDKFIDLVMTNSDTLKTKNPAEFFSTNALTAILSAVYVALPALSGDNDENEEDEGRNFNAINADRNELVKKADEWGEVDIHETALKFMSYTPKANSADSGYVMSQKGDQTITQDVFFLFPDKCQTMYSIDVEVDLEIENQYIQSARRTAMRAGSNVNRPRLDKYEHEYVPESSSFMDVLIRPLRVYDRHIEEMKPKGKTYQTRLNKWYLLTKYYPAFFAELMDRKGGLDDEVLQEIEDIYYDFNNGIDLCFDSDGNVSVTKLDDLMNGCLGNEKNGLRSLMNGATEGFNISSRVDRKFRQMLKRDRKRNGDVNKTDVYDMSDKVGDTSTLFSEMYTQMVSKYNFIKDAIENHPESIDERRCRIKRFDNSQKLIDLFIKSFEAIVKNKSEYTELIDNAASNMDTAYGHPTAKHDVAGRFVSLMNDVIKCLDVCADDYKDYENNLNNDGNTNMSPRFTDSLIACCESASEFSTEVESIENDLGSRTVKRIERINRNRTLNNRSGNFAG